MSDQEKALGTGAKDTYDTPEEAAAAALLEGAPSESAPAQASTPVTPPPASATANTGTTSANAGGPTDKAGA